MIVRFGGIVALLFMAVCYQGFGQEAGESRDYQYALIEAVKQKNLGNLSEAVKLYKLVIKEKADCDAAYYELGTIYLMTKQLELARTNLEKAYLLDPENQWYTLAYLNALGAVEDFDLKYTRTFVKYKPLASLTRKVCVTNSANIYCISPITYGHQ